MKYLVARVVALSCIVACLTIATIEIWPAVRRVRTEDQNGDGRPDVWRRYDSRGRLAEVDVDSNFDGKPDIAEYYERGVLVRRESDRNFNGQADLVEEFDAETHGLTRSVIDLDYDGTADLLVLFRDGHPIFSKRTPLNVAEIPRSSPPAVHQGAVTPPFTPLTDPFESDTAVRAAHIASSDDGCVGLSTSGGLPSARVTGISRMPASARLVGRDVQHAALKLLFRRSPRAPPVC